MALIFIICGPWWKSQKVLHSFVLYGEKIIFLMRMRNRADIWEMPSSDPPTVYCHSSHRCVQTWNYFTERYQKPKNNILENNMVAGQILKVKKLKCTKRQKSLFILLIKVKKKFTTKWHKAKKVDFEILLLFFFL